MEKYICFTMKHGESNMKFDPAYALIETNHIKGFITDQEDKNNYMYRYYSIPDIYQREINEIEIERIIHLKKFVSVWGYKDSLFYVSKSKSTIHNKDSKLLTFDGNVSTDQCRFDFIYPLIINTLKEEYCLIRSITFYRNIKPEYLSIVFIDEEGKENTLIVEKVK